MTMIAGMEDAMRGEFNAEDDSIGYADGHAAGEQELRGGENPGRDPQIFRADRSLY